MNSGKLVCGSFLVAFGLFTAGCVVDAGEPPAADDDEDVAAAEAPLSVDHSTFNLVEVWDSGNLNSLSDWMSINCATTYRDGNDSYMVTDFTAFKEPTTNFDNFIGKLNGTCTDYTSTGLQTGTPQTDNIFTGSWRAGGLVVSAPLNEVPIGVRLKVYSGSPSYVKDIAIGSTLATFGGTTSWSSFATGYSGDQVTRKCDPGQVMTGFRLKYDTDNGKIRHVQMFCRNFN